MKIILSTFVVFLSFSVLSFAQNERPQTPKAPFKYNIEEVTYTNKDADSVVLSGTLTLPKKVKNPAVAILINGSGAHDRDCNIAGHKPFWVIADYLTNNGIAVLRFDERGVGKSTGDIRNATTYDLASDVEAGIKYLKTRTDIDQSKIGLIGHSEGGIIAPMVASKNNDIAFIVMLAGPGVRGDQLLETQNKKILKSIGLTEEALNIQLELNSNFYRIILEEKNDSIRTKIETFINKYQEKNKDNKTVAFILNPVAKKQMIDTYSIPWLIEFIRLDPKPFLEKTTCPVLALNGTKDFQVLHDVNLPAIEAHLKTAKNKDVTIKKIEDLNHLFQTAKTGSTSEYTTLEETFSNNVLKLISDWINTRF
ncbi:alpha/beta hydrolase family protein [Olleya aquimaris]|uniref:Serine aminopeptidase S33 domain-containing protein n=1 Tax=Olleya aquimaris TaxID=639310 RepID=A0A327RC29_9FLAO|nr:alpha/beta fold hydrolase [Olleya aquimaris]RAJ14470.1 hypothetical protein LY08_01645 [Olleya aquimaris]